MNRIIFPENVDDVIQSFYELNAADEATTDIIFAIGAELLDIEPDDMKKRIGRD